MATLNSVIVPAKVLKDGHHKVRISVAHNGETRYIVTDIIIDLTKEFKNGKDIFSHNFMYITLSKIFNAINMHIF